jgi:hypothetical protein
MATVHPLGVRPKAPGIGLAAEAFLATMATPTPLAPTRSRCAP